MTTSMLNTLTIRILLGAGLLAAIPTVTGCKAQPEADRQLNHLEADHFTSSEEPRQVHRIFDAAAASGARADATLHPAHFDAGNPKALSSLGENKLDLMLSDDDALPMVVYLNVADTLQADCENSVRVYLRDRGLTEAQVKVVAGRNPGAYNATAPRIKDANAADGKQVQLNGSISGGMK